MGEDVTIRANYNPVTINPTFGCPFCGGFHRSHEGCGAYLGEMSGSQYAMQRVTAAIAKGIVDQYGKGEDDDDSDDPDV